MWDKVFIYILQMKASKFYPSRQDLQYIMRYISNTLQRRHNGHDGYEITSIAIVCSTVYSGANQRKHQSSASLAFVREIHRWPVNSSHKWPVMGKMFPFDDVITYDNIVSYTWHGFCWVVRLGGTVCTIYIYIYIHIYMFSVVCFVDITIVRDVGFYSSCTRRVNFIVTITIISTVTQTPRTFSISKEICPWFVGH